MAKCWLIEILRAGRVQIRGQRYNIQLNADRNCPHIGAEIRRTIDETSAYAIAGLNTLSRVGLPLKTFYKTLDARAKVDVHYHSLMRRENPCRCRFYVVQIVQYMTHIQLYGTYTDDNGVNLSSSWDQHEGNATEVQERYLSAAELRKV